jgi:predicted dehydrogenase
MTAAPPPQPVTAAQARIAIIGAGSRGIQCFGSILGRRRDAAVVALHDTNAVRVQAGCQHLGGGAKGYTDLQAMLSSERPDAVVVTSPDAFHEEHAVAALQAGAHVLVDKPMAITARGCRRILDTAKAAGRNVFVGFNYRQIPTMQRLKQIVDSGVLGRLFLIESREFYSNGRTFMSRWNRHYHLSGGLWVHKGIHDFDLFNWLLGFPRPLRVSATAGISALHPQGLPFPLKDGVPAGPDCSSCAYAEVCPDVFRPDGDELGRQLWGSDARGQDSYVKNTCIYLSDKSVHDNGIAIVEYEGGVRASLMECFVCGLDDRLTTLVGDRGVAEVSLHRREIRIHPRWNKGEVVTYQLPQVDGGHGGGDEILIEKFLSALQGRQATPPLAEQGLWATAIGEAAELAWRQNRTIEIAELFQPH